MSSRPPARLWDMRPKITPNLWFDTEAEEAAAFYVSVFPNARVVAVTRYPEGAPREAGMVMTVEFELDGQRFIGINGGTQFSFDEAISFSIDCADQEEVDRYWSLLSDGGSEGPCGWLKDKFGVSWQVVPVELEELCGDYTTPANQAACQAMLKMGKIDIAELQAAYDGA